MKLAEKILNKLPESKHKKDDVIVVQKPISIEATHDDGEIKGGSHNFKKGDKLKVMSVGFGDELYVMSMDGKKFGIIRSRHKQYIS
jgi:hypothetical protein